MFIISVFIYVKCLETYWQIMITLCSKRVLQVKGVLPLHDGYMYTHRILATDPINECVSFTCYHMLLWKCPHGLMGEKILQDECFNAFKEHFNLLTGSIVSSNWKTFGIFIEVFYILNFILSTCLLTCTCTL